MKKVIFIISLSILFCASCADKFLDTQSPSRSTSENVFKSVFFTDAAIMGVYSVLTEATVYGQKISTNWPTNSDIEFAGLTDDPKAPTRDVSASNYYAVAVNQNTKWDQLFKLAELATIAADGIRKSPLLQTSDSTVMKAYLGEALTLKALAYFELVKHYGDVPFKKEPSKSDLSNVYVPKEDRDTTYKYIIQDLLEAQNYVPWLGGNVSKLSYANADRINKGFIKGLTARVALFAGGWSIRDRNIFTNTTAESHPEIAEMNGYFTGRCKDWRKYYEIANQQCAEILGSSSNPHHLDDFENLWKTVNQLQYNSANENLFEVGFGVGTSGDIGSLICMRLDANSKYGPIGLGGGNVLSSAYYFYSFDPDDERRDVTVTNISYTANNKENFNNNPVDWKFAKWRIYWMTDAYKNLLKNATGGRIGTGINWIVMRYSDIYLMFAEAQNELYGPDVENSIAKMTARVALEKVRERAFKDNPSKITAYDHTNFFDALVNERAWEFGGEALRKYDLIRWGLLSKKIEAQKEALVKMLDGKGEVKIFDKTYDASLLPKYVYYKLQSNGEYIERDSINFYSSIAAPAGYTEVTWLSQWALSGSNLKTYTARILIANCGLNASYDYSSLVAQMDSAVSVQNHLNTFQYGNGVCNYRHPFGIYINHINDSRGTLVNSYGY